MKAVNLMFFIVCVNLAAFIIHQSGTLPASQELYASPQDVIATFNIAQFELNINSLWVSLGVSGIMAGIIAFVTKQYMVTGAALTIWALCAFVIPTVGWIFTGVPYMLQAMGAPWYITETIKALFAFVFFIFMLEVTTQRSLT